jgi:NTE family protein
MSLFLRMTAMVFATVFACSTAFAQNNPPDAKSQDAESARPKIALVLSGGGARGFAHIGVLRLAAHAGSG